jgi:CRP/FNR family cyclic AMP-dependent transcriptional regulator
MDLLSVFKESEDLLEVPAGTEIMAEGSAGNRMYIIITGEVAITLKHKNIATIKTGEIVGEMALINSDVRSATATAKTDCTLALIDQSSFKLLLKHVPDFAQHVIRVLTTRLQAAYQMVGN